MDTSTHVLLGITLGGLAMVDPVISQHEHLGYAVMIGTVVGSNAPDLDAVSRFKGFSFYMKHHRGATHSLNALFIWPFLLSLPLAWGFGLWEHLLHLLLWTFLAVGLHVFLDWTNTYGVQCFRPFTRDMKHLDWLCIFDPVLFIMHVTGLILWWGYSLDPAAVFMILYSLSFLYIVSRAAQHFLLLRKLRKEFGIEGIYHIIPTLNVLRWQFFVEESHSVYSGEIKTSKIITTDHFVSEKDNPIIEATRSLDGVRAFLGFAKRFHVQCSKRPDGYEVTWSDLRFYYNRKLSFGVDVKLDDNLKVISCKFGYRKKNWEPPYI